MPWETTKNKRKKKTLPAVEAKEVLSTPKQSEKPIENGGKSDMLSTAGMPISPVRSIFKSYGDLTKAWYKEVHV